MVMSITPSKKLLMNRYLQASTRWHRAVLESRDNQLVTSTVVKLLQHWELKCYFKTEVTKIMNRSKL